MGRYDNLVEKIKTIDTEVVKDWDSNTDPAMKIVEEQKVYIWIRLFLKEEANVEVGDDIYMTYTPSGEKLDTKFICFGKEGAEKDQDGLTNWNSEENKRVLCLMVDQEKINKGTDIPFIRTLFKLGRFYEDNLIRRDELQFIIEKNNILLEYYDCDF